MDQNVPLADQMEQTAGGRGNQDMITVAGKSRGMLRTFVKTLFQVTERVFNPI